MYGNLPFKTTNTSYYSLTDSIADLPSKAQTEEKRRENRTKYRKMAKDALSAGKYKEARDCFQRCIDITPSMARELIVALQERNVDCIVAPYEADAQLAFLHKAGYV